MDERVQEYQNEADKNEILLWACARGLIGDVVELLNQGALPDCKDKHGFYPVHFAACHGHLDVLQCLSTKGIDIDAEDRSGRTALHFAALHNHAHVAKFLVKKGAWTDGFDGDDNSALHLAAREGHIGVVRILANSGAKVHLVNKRSLTPLGEALVAGHLEVAKLLLEKNVDVKARSRRFTLLHLIAGLGREDSLAFLLQNGAADLVNDADNPEKVTPLHAAAAAGSLACAQLLLKHGADATWQDAEGCFPADKLPPTPVAGPTVRAMKQLSKLLSIKPSAWAAPPQARHSGSDSASKEPRELTFREKFLQMKLEEQIQKVEALARLNPSVLKDMDFLDQEARAGIDVVRKTSEALDCYKAVVAVRRDEEFQEDASDPDMQEAIEHIRQTNSLEGYSNKEKVMAVLLKLRQLQAVLRAAGGVKLQLQDLLVKNEPEHYQKDEDRLAAMQKNLRRSKEVAVQIISGKPVQEAAPVKAVQEGAPSKSSHVQQEEPTGATYELELLNQRDAEGPKKSLWERVARELLMQLLQVVVVAVVLLSVLWVTKRLPWQNEEWLGQQLRQREGPGQPAVPMDPAVAAHLAGQQPGMGAEEQFMHYPYGQGEQREDL